MRILIDLDDVLNDFASCLLFYNNRIHQTYHSISEIDRWDWWKDAYGKEWAYPLKTIEFWEDIDHDWVGFDFIVNMLDKGHEVKIVSASNYSQMLGFKINALLTSFSKYMYGASRVNYEPLISPTLCDEDIIICHDKSLIRGDILIDDNPNNLHDFPGVSITFAKPWNQQDLTFFRSNDWTDIEEYIDGLNIEFEY